ncbi:hypothetical protein [Muricoccus vinaceus]|uniref:Secreted protein n=1 Tax=Muricoccus vinaceus TaxID=424704 RepID=A0ABV6J0T9_9PROT
MSRRTLLGGLAAIVANPTAALPVQSAAADALDRRPAPSPDAEVIRLAHEVIEAEAACLAAYAVPSSTPEEEQAREPERDRLINAVCDKTEALAPLPVATLAGVLAKARAALAVADRNPADGEINVKDYAEWLAYAALEDLVKVMGERA